MAATKHYLIWYSQWPCEVYIIIIHVTDEEIQVSKALNNLPSVLISGKTRIQIQIFIIRANTFFFLMQQKLMLMVHQTFFFINNKTLFISNLTRHLHWLKTIWTFLLMWPLRVWNSWFGCEQSITENSKETFFFFFWPHHAACGILVPRPGIEPRPPTVEAWSPNHWTARELPTRNIVPCPPAQLNVRTISNWAAYCKILRQFLNLCIV